MTIISSEKTVYTMSPDNLPAAHAESGDIVRFETLDCFGGQITNEDQHLGGINWDRINPATGPLYIEQAEPGDTLRVEIQKIELDDHATVVEAPGEGITGANLPDEATRILPVKDGRVYFNDKLSFEISAMIGVIGTAPADESILTGTPGAHGGNMDCTRIGEGAVLYLPVNVKGALLAMGDMHAIMGDGEVCVCGAEIGGAITVKVTVIKGRKMPLPFLVTNDRFMTICSADTLDAAAGDATLTMRTFLMDELGMDIHAAGMLMSLCSDLRICQAVDPQKTCRMEVPLEVAEKYGYCFD
ncbi:MAG: acetamidase/formamidase family protein [Oscillospiraceae bacterium]